jgi:hypothetical protein
VDVENHVTGLVADTGIRISGSIVEEANKGLDSFFGAMRLRGSERPKGYKHCSIDRPRIVEERANNLLESRDAFGRELGGCAGEWAELDGGSIVRFELGMR